MTEGLIVTFYSYKGGVGRTLALSNIGALLCRWGYKVLCIDWDLEAPGLHLYFRQYVATLDRPGLTELIQSHVDGKKPKWNKYVSEVTIPQAKHPLSLITAGRQDESYVSRMQALDWSELYEKHRFGNFLEAMRGEWKESFDFVLIDSRTGITDIGGICTVQLPDFLVLLFTANQQSLHGSLEVAKRAARARNSLPFDRAKLLTLPVASRFEMRVEYEMAQQWLKTFADELRPLYAEWAHKDVTAEELLNHTRMPYIPYWSFGEKLPVIEKGTDDPEDIGFSLETLAALIAQKFSYSDVLVRNRDSFVSAVRKLPELKGSAAVPMTKSGQGVKLFISYSHKDKKLLDELEKHLGPLVRQGVIETWHDRSISPGEDWKKAISAHLEESDIILLLLSADFLASDYAYEVEARRALERHMNRDALVIPVILRDVDWSRSPFDKLQALPKDGMPVTIWPNRDSAWRNVTEGIRKAAEKILASRHRA